MNHQKRFENLLSFIDEHLSESLSLETLGEQASMSKYHFHRKFSYHIGMPVQAYIRLMRFYRAAFVLSYRDTSITEIALAAQFESPEAFSRAFKKLIGLSPSAFRARPALIDEVFAKLIQIRQQHMQLEFDTEQVAISQFPETTIACLVHKGAPSSLGLSITKFASWRKKHGLSPTKTKTFNLMFDDPELVPADEYRFGLAVELPKEFEQQQLASGMEFSNIPAGLCACLRYEGDDACLDSAIRFMYTDWLNQSSYSLRDFPLFLRRIKFFPDVAASQAVSEIYLPLT